jgi:hypothetical protein
MSLSFILYFTYTNTKFSNIPHVPVLNDAHLLGGLLLTHRCPWGVAVIAGTGSIVVGLEVSEEGEVVQYGRRGGVGYLLGDDGSGKSPSSSQGAFILAIPYCFIPSDHHTPHSRTEKDPPFIAICREIN